MAAGVAVFHAATWVFSHSAELTWASLAIVVPDPSQVPIIEQLGRLKTRGVRMGTIAQAEQARHFDRVLIAYTPDAATIERAEALAEARVVVAIGGDPHALRTWVNQYRPVHLGGADLLATPTPQPLGPGPVVAA
ncbi:hypothetical protein [Kocuria sp. KH4]